jgi:hypothetical protein
MEIMVKTSKELREERLAKQLRANLAKRKAQLRGRDSLVDKVLEPCHNEPCPDLAPKTS